MNCYICHRKVRTINSLFSHLRQTHGLCDSAGQIYRCGQGVCAQTFSSFSGYRRHLKLRHSEVTCNFEHELPELPERPLPVEDNEFDDTEVDDMDQPDAGEEGPESSILSPQEIEEHASAFVSKLCSKPNMSEAHVNDILDSANDFIENIVSSASAAVSVAFESNELPPDSLALQEIQAHLRTLQTPFENLKSDYHRMKYICRKGMVKPYEIALGNRYENRLNRETNQVEEVAVSDTFTYVPILETLESLVKHPDVLHHVTHSHKSDDGIIRDFCDGELYGEIDLFKEDPNALQLHFFYDDFVTVNPLGSKTIHKLGAFYFVLKNLPPKFNSSLHNIHLAAICYSADIKKYGFSKILQHLVEDLNTLSTKGIRLPDGTPKKGTITQFSADNLGANSLFGFVESFSALYFCRLCVTNKHDAQEIFTEIINQMRSRESYSLHVQEAGQLQNAGHVFGIKNSCMLNECMYFHVLVNFSLDIMHDILEGVAQYELKLVLCYLTQEMDPPLSLNELRWNLQSHDYGKTDMKNKPSHIKLDAGNTLGQKAMQAWCLLRHIPFVIADKIEEDDPYWELILKLLECMDIIFSPRLTPGLIAQLRILIEEHHAHFRRIFPNDRLLPKHHLMIHYPTCLRKIGPLVHVWCMRFEGKHDYFARVADALRNYKNICKSLGKRHQVMQAYHMLANKPLKELQVGPGKQCHVSSLTADCIHLVMEKIPMSDFSTQVFDTNWIVMCGTKYQPSMFVCFDVEELPVFGKIHHILVHEDNILLVLHVWETMCYNRHYHAYAVTNSSNCFIVTAQDELIDYQPLDLLTNLSDQSQCTYLSPRHVLFK